MTVAPLEVEGWERRWESWCRPIYEGRFFLIEVYPYQPDFRGPLTHWGVRYGPLQPDRFGIHKTAGSAMRAVDAVLRERGVIGRRRPSSSSPFSLAPQPP